LFRRVERPRAPDWHSEKLRPCVCNRRQQRSTRQLQGSVLLLAADRGNFDITKLRGYQSVAAEDSGLQGLVCRLEIATGNSAFYFRVQKCSVQSAGNQSASSNNAKYINLQERNSCDDPTFHSASSNSEKRVLKR